jgi:hypothetical protein
MQKISSAADLKTAIQVLETENKINGKIFRDQLFIAYLTLKPLNIIKSTLQGISAPTLTEEISGTSFGLLGGFLSRKIFVGTSGNTIRKLIGSALQLGVTAVVSQNSGVIQSAGISLIKYFIQRNTKKATGLNP